MAQKKKRKLKVLNLLLLIAIVLAIAAGGLWFTYQQNIKPVSSADETVLFEVSSGTSAKNTAIELEKQGIIKDSTSAYVYMKLNNLGDIKSGTYDLNKSWDVKHILTVLNDPTAAAVNTVSITIVEGDWAKDIAAKIEAETNVTADELLTLWNDADYLASLKDRYAFITDEMFSDSVRIYLEGYLMPDTYIFYKETDAKSVTEKILDQTEIVFEKYKQQIADSGYSTHQIFTLASIVQYEASTEEDMKMIAGVFYNRLNIDMALQSSVTVCYAIDFEKQTDNWTACEVNNDFESPYNTYKYTGLPPGPIMNPGSAALDAVLNPTKSNYYYFMADVYGDGAVHYAETYQEHEANVQKYLR